MVTQLRRKRQLPVGCVRQRSMRLEFASMELGRGSHRLQPSGKEAATLACKLECHHAGIEAWLQEPHASSAEQQHVAEPERQSTVLLHSDGMEPEWQVWKAALHALAAIPQSEA